MAKQLLFPFLFLISTNLYPQCSDSVVIAITQEENYPDEWVNWRQITDTYDASGNHVTYNYQLWNSNLTWNSIYYSLMNYDLQGHRIDSVVQMNSPLVNKFKFRYVYDLSGYLSSDTVWNWDGSSWQYGNCYSSYNCNPSLTEHYHDINNHDSIDIHYIFNNGWKLNSRTLSTVNINGQHVDQVIQNYDTSTGNWINYYHYVKTFNIYGQETYVLSQAWDSNFPAWENDWMFTTVTDSSGYILSSESVSGYDTSIGSNWFYHDYNLFIYDSLHRLIGEHQTHVHHSGSDGNTDILYQYDSQGRLIFSDYIRDTDISYAHRRTFYHYTKTIEAFAGGSKSVCSGIPTRINGDGFGGCGNIYYQWNPAFAFDDANSKNPNVNLQNSGWVYLTVTDDSSNSSVDSAYIFVKPQPSITLTNDSSNNILCQGSSIQFSADTTGVIAEGWQLLHDNMFVSGSYSSLSWPITVSGNYSLITYNNGCVDTSNTIQITNAPAVLFSSSSNAATCIGCSDAVIFLTPVTGTQPFIYSWSPMNGMISGDSIIHLPAGEYIVCAEDAIHCNSYCDTISVNELPTGIEETSAIFNSSFYPLPVTNESILKIEGAVQELSLLIFDLNGKAVRRTVVNQGINKFRKENLSAGMYYYFILSEQETVFTGKLMIAD